MIYSIYADGKEIWNSRTSSYLTNAVLTREKGSAGSLEVSCPNIKDSTEKAAWDSTKLLKTIFDVYDETKTKTLIWEGRILTITTDIYGNRDLFMEGALSFLNDTAIPPYNNEDYDEKETNVFNKDDTRIQSGKLLDGTTIIDSLEDVEMPGENEGDPPIIEKVPLGMITHPILCEEGDTIKWHVSESLENNLSVVYCTWEGTNLVDARDDTSFDYSSRILTLKVTQDGCFMTNFWGDELLNFEILLVTENPAYKMIGLDEYVKGFISKHNAEMVENEEKTFDYDHIDVSDYADKTICEGSNSGLSTVLKELQNGISDRFPNATIEVLYYPYGTKNRIKIKKGAYGYNGENARVGVNVLDFSYVEDGERVATYIIPYFEKKDGTITIKNEQAVHSGMVKYGKIERFYKIKGREKNYKNSEIKDQAKEYLQKILYDYTDVSVNFIDMFFIDGSYHVIKPGEKILVANGNILLNVQKECTKIVENLIDPTQNEYTLVENDVEIE